MNVKKKRKVKNISLETNQETSKKETSQIKNSTPNNSFYDEEHSFVKGKWYEDVRKKSLLVFVLSLVIIGGMIPSGMAATGYFNHHTESAVMNHPKNEDEKNEFAMKNAINQAYIDNLEKMKDQGWVGFDLSAYNYFKKEVNDEADKKIKTEKEDMKKKYGNTWETAWNQKLSSEGFKDDKQYKNSIIVTDYKNKTLNIIKTQQFRLSEGDVTKKSKYNPFFCSEKNNSSNIFKWLNNNNPANKPTLLTEENLMKLFLLFYQPIQFNDTLTPFTPYKSGDSSKADITGDSIKITNKQITDWVQTWKYLNSNNETDRKQWPILTPVYNKIMSENNLSLPKPIENVSVYQSKLLSQDTQNNNDGKKTFDTTTPVELAKKIREVFKVIDTSLPPNEIPQETIDQLTTSKLEEFGSKLTKAMSDASLLNKGDKKRANTVIWQDPYKEGIGNAWNKYVSYIGEDGLHFLGITAKNFNKPLEDSNTDKWSLDNPLVESYLNYLNGNAGMPKSYGLEESFDSWVESNLDNIIYAMSNGTLKSFLKKGTEPTIKDKVVNRWLNNWKFTALNDVNNKYKEAKDFYNTNYKLYDNDAFSKSDYFSTLLNSNNIYNNIYNIQKHQTRFESKMNKFILIRPKEYDAHE